MVSTETLPFPSFARATAGQITLYYIHTILDYEERERRVHLKCLPKWKEDRCEVCGEVVNLLADYSDALSGKAFTPREYVEHQLHMSDEEKEQRTVFFTELFAANSQN